MTMRQNLVAFIMLALNLPAGEQEHRIKSTLKIKELRWYRKELLKNSQSVITEPVLDIGVACLQQAIDCDVPKLSKPMKQAIRKEIELRAKFFRKMMKPKDSNVLTSESFDMNLNSARHSNWCGGGFSDTDSDNSCLFAVNNNAKPLRSKR